MVFSVAWSIPGKPEELIETVTAVPQNPSPRAGADGIDMFSTRKFRTRVTEWCQAQVAALPRNGRPRSSVAGLVSE
jgi:hypothetical protein